MSSAAGAHQMSVWTVRISNALSVLIKWDGEGAEMSMCINNNNPYPPVSSAPTPRTGTFFLPTSITGDEDKGLDEPGFLVFLSIH